jgi:hypothetical protein
VEIWRESQILKFERRQDKGVPESGLDWEDPIPELSEVSTFREASLTKRGDMVWRRQPGAQVQGEVEGLILAQPRLGQGLEEEQNGGGDSPKPGQSVHPERSKGLKPGPGPRPRLPGVG